MSFNVNQFVKRTALSVSSRVLDDIVTGATRGLPNHLIGPATDSAQSLFNAGSSFSSISSLTSQRTDAIVNQGPDIFFALAGKDPARASSADLRRLRFAGNESTDYYINNVNPASAIANKRRDAAEFILSAVS